MRTRFDVTPDQAAYVLQHLLEQRRIVPADVKKALGQMENEIRDLEKRLSSLRGLASARRTAESRTPRKPRRQRSAAQRESFREQGEYLNLLRHLSPRERAHYKKIAKEQGRPAAVKELRAAKSSKG